jgi:hypothetical protein
LNFAALRTTAFDYLGFGIKILGPFAELVPDLLPNCGLKQVAASLRFRPQVLRVHRKPSPSSRPLPRATEFDGHRLPIAMKWVDLIGGCRA